jgi:hypothetical protein
MHTCPVGQVLPHRPQLVGDRFVLISHPFRAFMSQSPKPRAQVSPQRPAAQVAVALGPATHALRHTPQWFRSVCVSTSQSLEAMPSQSARPAAHVLVVQPPDSQRAPAPQAFMHRPQCVVLARVSVSQPLSAMPSQSAKPALQRNPQAPAAQVALAFGRSGHAFPQRAQCDALVRVSTSQPVAADRSQSAKSMAQVATPHTPMAQAPVAFAGAQARPQAPQCPRVVASSTSHPLDGSMSQSAKPALQVNPHIPPPQVVAALGRIGHALPHRPQCATAMDVSVSQPLAPSMSQSA